MLPVYFMLITILNKTEFKGVPVIYKLFFKSLIEDLIEIEDEKESSHF